MSHINMTMTELY